MDLIIGGDFMIIVFFIGTCLGSFCKVVADRLVNEEDFIFKRSYCEICHHELILWEIIPLISYLFLRGKCRYCKKKIDIMHVFLEALSGCFFVGIFYKSTNLLELFVLTLFWMIGYIISLIDIKSFSVYEITLRFLFVISIICCMVLKKSLLDLCLGALIISFPLYILHAFKPEWIGVGDIELLLIFGMMAGVKGSLVGFSLAVHFGLCYALIKEDYRIPFCPFIVLGFFFSFMLIM